MPNLERGLQVLKPLLEYPDGLPRSDIAALLRCSKTGVYRIAMTLLAHRYQIRDKALSQCRHLDH